MALTSKNPSDLESQSYIDALGDGVPAVRTSIVSQGSQAPAISAVGSLQTPVTASATGAAAAIAATLPGVANQFTYLTGFQVTGAGATAGSVVTITVTGVVSGTMSYSLVIPAGAAVSVTPLIVSFPIPIPSSAVNTAIVVNVPSFGAGNTNAAVAAQGFRQ